MENLGIPDGADSPTPNGADSPTPEHPTEGEEGSPSPTQGTKTKKKGMDVDSLSDESKNLLLNFLIFLESENMTVGNFFAEVKYEQMVKTKKNKPSSVDIVPAEDFFRLIQEQYDIISDVDLTDEVKEELQNIL
mmetsp:Transcript_24656/g.27328  ORF Transcript_24656/g.27328 Transcript_24656/m.27328 type:complete len:134 (+) Transcript_24656:1-402(+)